MKHVILNPNDKDALAALYIGLKISGRADIVFYGGHDIIWFIEEMMAKASFMCMEDGNIMGFGIVNECLGKLRCEVSFGFLPICKAKDAIWFGKEMMRYVFDFVKPDYVFGTTPAGNQTALKYARLIGMSQVATIPNYVDYKGSVDDAVISYIDRKTWENGRQTKEADIGLS